MNVVALLEIQAYATQQSLALYVIKPFSGIYHVVQLSLDPAKSDVIEKRYTSREKAENYLLSLLPKPAATRVDC